MITSKNRSLLPWRTLANSLSLSIQRLTLAAGILTAGVPQALAYEAPTSSGTPVQAALLTQSVEPQPVSDGVYLYGQSPEAEQIGSIYMVFEVQGDQVIGASYMPYSSFDCFYGSLEDEQLSLTVINSYEQTEYPYAIALQSDSTVAGAGAPEFGLSGYHPIETVSSNDQRILSTCKADLAQR